MRCFLQTPVILGIVVLLVACGGATGTTPTAEPSTPAAPTATTTAVDPAATTADPVAGNAGDFDLADWDSVIAAASGQTVNWYMWGGSESINNFVDTFYGQALAERYDIALNRVPVADTVDVVNQVLSEKEAGIDPGNVDLIWINGENFLSLKQADMLFPSWAQVLPNSSLVDWDNPAINRDFG
ncbi:MAG: hypothetical protein MI924_05390, partial [Chloroflexales bacterium]|nr:hypothetical protein [Chloroflexales bacterium]